MSDYDNFLREMGLTQEHMDIAASTLPEPLPREADEPFYVADSKIHGKGIFASEDTTDYIATLRTGNQWNEAGRYANHAKLANAKALRCGEHVFLFGTVKKGEEITVDYRNVRDVL